MFAAPPSLPPLSPADAKAAAGKAKADPKAAAAAAAEAAAALAAAPLLPCSLLSQTLAAELNPVIFTPCKVLLACQCLSAQHACCSDTKLHQLALVNAGHS